MARLYRMKDLNDETYFELGKMQQDIIQGK